jgi:hypothetical protein
MCRIIPQIASSIVISAFAGIAPSQAATDAWSSAGGQGIYEYSISNRSGDTLRIVNGVSAELTHKSESCWVVFESSRMKIPDRLEMNILLDGRTYSFMLENGETGESAKADVDQLFGLVDALKNSNTSRLSAVFPHSEVETTFSTRNARETLEDALDGCD